MSSRLSSFSVSGRAAIFAASLLLAVAPSLSRADDANDDALEKQEQSLAKDAKGAKYEAALEAKYGLTADQLKALHDKGMNDSQITMAAALAKASGKSIDDIVKMRLDEKMGWGKIAKELGVPPSTLGHSIAAMHDHKDLKADAKKERDEERSERAAMRADRKAERAEHKHQ